MAFEEIKNALIQYTNVRYGHWIYACKDYVCSKCFNHSDKHYSECPNCSAKMDEKPGGDKVDDKKEQKE